MLQSNSAIDKHITEDLVYSLASAARPKEINEVLTLAVQNKFIEARKKLLDVMLNYGLSGIDVLKQIQKEIINLDTEFRMTEGSDEYLQLEAFLSIVCLSGTRKIS